MTFEEFNANVTTWRALFDVCHDFECGELLYDSDVMTEDEVIWYIVRYASLHGLSEGELQELLDAVPSECDAYIVYSANDVIGIFDGERDGLFDRMKDVVEVHFEDYELFEEE